VLTHLPPMAEVIVPVSMSPLQRKLYKSILSKDATLIRAILYKGDKVKTTERAKLNNLLVQLRKCVCHPYLYNSEIEEDTTGQPLDEVFGRLVEAGSKLKLLNIMLPKLKERGHRVLLFSQFLGMLDIVEDFLNHLGLKFHRLDGSVSTLEKQKRIDEFNAPGSDYFAFLLSTRAGGVGINLATADTVIILDPDFNPHQDIQALSRAHRIGQKNKVLVFHLMTRDTAEEKIMQIGKKKLSLDHLIIEKMGGEDDVEEEVIDVESILSFGAKRLFDDDEDEDRIIKYDDESVDKLLDRSQIEQTKTTDAKGDGSAENAFSFARVWANDKGSLEEAEEAGEDETTEPGFWDRVLKEREEEARREAEAKLEELGRGRRRKTTNVNYAMVDRDDVAVAKNDDHDSDTDYMADDKPDSADESEPEIVGHDDMMLAEIPPHIHRPPQGSFIPPPAYPQSHPFAQPPPPMPPVPFKRTPILPPGRPFGTTTGNNSLPRCLACKNRHAPGTCPLKQAGVEKCPMCKLAHLSKPGACPHFMSETQLDQMLETLRSSNEPAEEVEAAKRVVREQKRLVRRKKQRAKAKEMAGAGAAGAGAGAV
jgi:chromodomain-helicase-DNA-binding protein 4